MLGFTGTVSGTVPGLGSSSIQFQGRIHLKPPKLGWDVTNDNGYGLGDNLQWLLNVAFTLVQDEKCNTGSDEIHFEKCPFGHWWLVSECQWYGIIGIGLAGLMETIGGYWRLVLSCLIWDVFFFSFFSHVFSHWVSGCSAWDTALRLPSQWEHLTNFDRYAQAFSFVKCWELC